MKNMCQKPRKKTVAGALVFLVFAGAGFAQNYRNFEADFREATEGRGLRLGFIRILPVFRLSDVGRDSNIYYRDNSEAPVADTVARASADIKAVAVAGNSLILNFTYSPEYVFYARETDLRTLSHSISPGFRLLLFRSLVLSGDYHDRTSARRATSEFDRQVIDNRKGFSGSLFYESPRGTALGVTGTIDDFHYEDILSTEESRDYARALDRKERSGFFEVYYRVGSESFVFTRFGLADYSFRLPESSWRDAWSFETSAGVRFPLLGRARGRISLGYKKFAPRDELREPFSGLIASTDFRVRLGFLGITLGYLRDNTFSYLESAYYYVDDSFKGGLSLYVTRFLRLDGSLERGSMTYPEPHVVWFQGEPVDVVDRKDRRNLYSAGLVIRISGEMGFGVSYNSYRRTSNAPGFEIDRDFVGAFITYEF
jgi:hypothetical protein